MVVNAEVARRLKAGEQVGDEICQACPALVVPAGVCAATRLPLAVSFVAARGHDRALLGMAAPVGEALRAGEWAA